jgi:hypothetical protein
LGGAAIHLLLWTVSEPTWIFSDFYKSYWTAAVYLWEDGLNATWPLTEWRNWTMLPVVAWVFVPLAPLGDEAAAWTYLAIGLAAMLVAWASLKRLAGLKEPYAALLLFLFLVNGPLVNSLREGNSTHFVLLLLVVALLLWQATREFGAGLVLGVCATIKLPLLLFGLYFLLRRRWYIVAGGATSIGIAVLLSLAIFGLSGNLGWYHEIIEPYLGAFIPAFNVQSIDGFLLRLTTGASKLHNWEPFDPSAWHKIARIVIFAALYGAAFWLIWRADKSRPSSSVLGGSNARNLLEFSLVLNLALVTSPISWTHYYLFLLLPMALYLGGRLPLPDDAITRWLMRIGFLLVSLPVVMPDMAPGWFAEFVARTVVSVWLCGGLIMFAALSRAAWQTEAQVAGFKTSSRAIRP